MVKTDHLLMCVCVCVRARVWERNKSSEEMVQTDHLSMAQTDHLSMHPMATIWRILKCQSLFSKDPAIIGCFDGRDQAILEAYKI